MKRVFGIVSLVVPSLLAAAITLDGRHERIAHVTSPALAALWVVMMGALVMRLIQGQRARRADDLLSHWDHIDVLTSSGASMMWMGAGALIAAELTGFASLSVIGILGLGVVYLTTTWTALVAGGAEPWRLAEVTRAILPETAVEGDRLREELRLTNVKIPVGTRLFAVGRSTPHGAVTRYSVGSTGSRSDVKLESDLGLATRGEHRAPAMALWLGDVLGLSRAPIVLRGEVSFTVLPKPGSVDNVKQLLGNGGDDAISRPTHKLPTEGTFRIREYVPGDDTRRIHWVRSLQIDQLVVRLPDEIPPAEPRVRLILDTHLWGMEFLSCRAPDDLLDAMVRVWLGIAKELTDTGTRVTLVAGAQKGDGIAAIERPMMPRMAREGLRLGARVRWQPMLPLAALIAKNTTTRQIVVTSQPQPTDVASDVVWVVVPEVAWTVRETWPPEYAPVTLPFPAGSADNRFLRRLRERRRIEAMWRDRIMFSQVRWVNYKAFSGSLVARPNEGRIALTVIP